MALFPFLFFSLSWPKEIRMKTTCGLSATWQCSMRDKLLVRRPLVLQFVVVNSLSNKENSVNG